MKFISATSFLLISSSSGFANAALPPGHDDNMHCPPGNCSLYIQHPPGFAGPKRAFYKCYDETTDKTTEAVWTGFRTQVEAPLGWTQDPEECDVASSPTPPNPHTNIDTPGGMCVNDSDCYTTIRSAEPLGAIGPGLCECYATSKRNPFDETEDSTNVRMARCDPSACDGFEAYCPLAPNDNGMAECALRPIGSSSSLPSDDTPPSRPKKRPAASASSSSSSSDDFPRPPFPKRPATSSSTSSSSDDSPGPLPKRPVTSSSTTTSSSSDDSPRPRLPIKKIKPDQSSTSTSSDDSSSSNVIVSPTPAPPVPVPVKAVAEM